MAVTFWGQIIPAGQTAFLHYPSDSILHITSATLGSFPNSAPSDPIRLQAKVQTARPGETGAKEGDPCAITETTVTLCLLRPIAEERQGISATFSVMNIVEVTNLGAIDVHLSGVLDPLPSSDEESSEEDGEQEGLSADEIQGRFRDLASRQGPRPPPKAKARKKKGRSENYGW
jgi:hypothetical protein